jgi:hypothetical protein
MRHSFSLFSLAFILFTGLNGCINLGPDYQRPDLDIEIPESYQNDRSEQTVGPVIEDRWWQDFGDPELDVLVEEVLKRNWDLKQAAARIIAARAQYVQVSADRWPQVGFNYDWDKRRFGGVNVGRGQTITTQPKLPKRHGMIFWLMRKTAEPWPRPWWLKPSICICRLRRRNADCKSPIRALKPLSAVCNLSRPATDAV